MELVFNQFYTFIIMLVFGILMGAGFDIYRYITNNIKNQTIINTLDILVGITAGLAAFFVLIYINWGVFRFYVIIAIFSGIFCYYKLIKILNPGK